MARRAAKARPARPGPQETLAKTAARARLVLQLLFLVHLQGLLQAKTCRILPEVFNAQANHCGPWPRVSPRPGRPLWAKLQDFNAQSLADTLWAMAKSLPKTWRVFRSVGHGAGRQPRSARATASHRCHRWHSLLLVHLQCVLQALDARDVAPRAVVPPAAHVEACDGWAAASTRTCGARHVQRLQRERAAEVPDVMDFFVGERVPVQRSRCRGIFELLASSTQLAHY